MMAQNLGLRLPDREVEAGQTVKLPVLTYDFDSIVSLQFSLRWDTAVAEFVNWEEADLPFIAVGASEAEAGILRFSWFSNEGDGKSLADSSSLVDLTFRGVGEPGTMTDVTIGDQPLAIQVFRETATPGNFEEIGLDAEPGSIRIEAALGAVIQVQQIICFGQSNGSLQLQLAADPSQYTATWTGPNGFTASGYSLFNLAAGNYLLELRDQQGEVVFSSQVSVRGPASPLQMDTLRVEPATCGSTNGLFELTASGGREPYIFSTPDSVSSTGLFQHLPAGSYPVAVTDIGGCTVRDTVVITNRDAPQVSIGPDTVAICAGQELTLDVELQAGQTAAWSTGQTGSSIVVSSAGVYTVTVSSGPLCEASDTTTVVAGGELEPELRSDELSTCPGDTLHLAVGGGLFYRWVGETGGLSATDVPDPRATPDSSVTYRVEISDGCTADTLEVPVFVYQITASAGPDTCIAPGDPVELAASGGLFYEWLANPWPVSDPASPDPQAFPEDSTTYVVRITDVNECVTLDSVQVLVASDPLSTIRAINMITPNGDGINDVLQFEGVEKFGNNSLKVYNRWGQLVYQQADYQRNDERFDGTFKGEPLPAGNYFYVLTFRSGELRQTLTIIRE